MKTSKQIRNLCLTAMFGAIICILTIYVRIPTHTGYTHIGDSFIYLAGSILPAPYAAFAGALGAALADGLTGYYIWILPSIVIKTLTALCFTAKAKKILCKRNLFALAPAFILCAAGYYLAECLMTGNFVAPLAGIPGYIVQVAISAVIYVVLSKSLDHIDFKTKLS